MASIITQNSAIQMSTVRPGVMQALNPDPKRVGDVIEYEPVLSDSDSVLRIVSSEEGPKTSDLKNAAIIVAGGGGCKSKETFNALIAPLSVATERFFGEKSTVGASRVAVEMGFIDRSHQVGQTGQTVKPRLYIAVGISGAIQHISGMQNSQVVLAINKDPNAPIFKEADFGVVGDMERVIPELTEILNAKGGASS